MKYNGVVLSNSEPNKDVIWIKDGVMKYFNNGKWNDLSSKTEGSEGSEDSEGSSNSIPVVDLGETYSNNIDIYPGIMYYAYLKGNTNFILHDSSYLKDTDYNSLPESLEEFMLRLSINDDARPSFNEKRMALVAGDYIKVDYPISMTGGIKDGGIYDVSIVNGRGIIAKV